MGIFKKIFNNKNNKPAVNNDPFFDYIVSYFNNDDNFDVDDKGVLNISSDIKAITSRIANDIANKPIKSTNAYVAELLNNHINASMSAHDWKVATLMNLLVYGDSFSLIKTGKNNTISSIELLPTYQVAVIEGNSGIQYRFNNDEIFNGDQILHFKLDTINGLTGTSPLLALKNILKLSRSSNRLLRHYYKNSAFNKVLLNVKDQLGSDDKEKIKQAFESNLGTQNAGGTIVSDNKVDIQPFNTTAVNSNVIKETKNADYFAKKIAAVYGVPANLLGVINPHSNSSDVLSQYRLELKKYENIIIAELENKLQGTYEIQDHVTPINSDQIANLAKAGAITPIQAQQLLGLK